MKIAPKTAYILKLFFILNLRLCFRVFSKKIFF